MRSVCDRWLAFHAGAVFLVLSQMTAAAADQPGAMPLKFAYTLPVTGKVALVIDDAAGRRVRNLLAEAFRYAGTNYAEWDGCDDDGRLVPPGRYSFKGVVGPEAGLYYEFTVNNSGDPPWWKQDVWEPRRDPGGWISDHGAPTDVQAAGNVVFIASHSAEHGHCLIATDLAGRKIWGAKWLQDLAGSFKLACESNVLYSAGEGGWGGNRTQLFAIDPVTFAARKVAVVDYTTGLFGRPAGLAGLAARNGLVYASYNANRLNQVAIQPAPDSLDMQHTTAGGLAGDAVNGLLRVTEPAQPWQTIRLERGGDTVLRFAWKTDLPVGAVLSAHRLEVSVLKPGAAYPGNPAVAADWIALEADESHPALNIYTAPPGTRSRALRVRVVSVPAPADIARPQGLLSELGDPPGKFAGLRVVPLGLEALPREDEAGVAVSSGTLLEDGAWENRQAQAIDAAQPASYTVNFKRPVPVRCLVLRDPFFAGADIQVQYGGDKAWTTVASAAPTMYWRRDYADLPVDLYVERPIAAVRVLVTRPATTENHDVKTRTAGRPDTCSLGGILFLRSPPGGPQVEPDLSQRITVFDAARGTVVREFPLDAPGEIDFTAGGRLLAISGNRVVAVPPAGGAAVPVIATGLLKPSALMCAPDGSIYVGDSADHVVKQFDAAGKFLRAIGKPGGLRPGPYDPRNMSNPSGLTLDAEGKLWVAEHEYRPKKISVWSVAGGQPAALVRHFLGGPPYGGGSMYIDPEQPQPTRFFFDGMEFEADWQKGTHRLKNITWRPGYAGAWSGITCDRPIYHKGRLYLAGEPFWFYGRGYMALARYDKDHAVPVAAAGLAERWPPLGDPAVLKALGNPGMKGASFAWSDANDDSAVQPGEIKLAPAGVSLAEPYFGSQMGRDFAMQFAGACLAPRGFTAAGAPLYDFTGMRPTPEAAQGGVGLYNTALTSDDRLIEISSRIAVVPRKGSPSWSYPDHYNGVHGSANAPPPRAGMLAGSIRVIGQGTLPGIGEFFALVSNKGDIEVFTTDGLFVARLFRDHRYGRSFNLPKAERGMRLDGISINCEHFGGTLTQMRDGRVFLVVGHNHNSLIRVEGLDECRRFGGTVEFTPAQFLAAEQAVRKRVAETGKPKSLKIAKAPAGAAVDGALNDWAGAEFAQLQGAGTHSGRAALMRATDRLLLAFEVKGRKNMVNTGADFKMLFKSGDSVDLQLGANPDANKDRADPAAGDLRVSVSMLRGAPVAVIYRYVVPGTPDAKKHVFASPVGSVSVDAVEISAGAEIRVVPGKDGYVVEAGIPLPELGLRDPLPPAIRGDVGILFADEQGLGVSERVYWSNRKTGLVADVPGEIRLEPGMWGTFKVE